MEVGGLHHMTAVTTDASENAEFDADVARQRLEKDVVNQHDG